MQCLVDERARDGGSVLASRGAHLCLLHPPLQRGHLGRNGVPQPALFSHPGHGLSGFVVLVAQLLLDVREPAAVFCGQHADRVLQTSRRCRQFAHSCGDLRPADLAQRQAPFSLPPALSSTTASVGTVFYCQNYPHLNRTCAHLHKLLGCCGEPRACISVGFEYAAVAAIQYVICMNKVGTRQLTVK